MSEEKNKTFHVFISYRVASDADLAEKIADKLQLFTLPSDPKVRVQCFLDKQNLKAGESYFADLKNGLAQSCLFLPLISEGAIARMASLTAKDTDNVLLEYSLALKHKAENNLDILPLYVGEAKNNTYRRFSAFDTARFPEVACVSAPSATVAAIMKEMFLLQGIFVNPSELKDKLVAVVQRLSQVTWPKFRGRWHEQAEIGPEGKERCVQCDQDFLPSQNGDGHCSFHTKGFWSGMYQCCRKRQQNAPGCVTARHRSRHHQDYPYAAFAKWRNGICGYTDRWVQLADATVENYPANDTLKVLAGLCIAGPDKGSLTLTTGSRFQCLTPADIAALDATKPIEAKGQDGSWGRFTWLPDPATGEVTGVRLESSFAGSPHPATVIELRLSAEDERRFRRPTGADAEPAVLTRGGIVEAAPATPYRVAEGTFIKGAAPRAVRVRDAVTDLPTASADPDALSLRIVLGERLRGQQDSQQGRDLFQGSLDVCNLGAEPAALLRGKAAYCLGSRPAGPWAACASFSAATLPLTIPGKGIQALPFSVGVSHGGGGGGGYAGRLAHGDTLWFRFTLEDMAGNTSTTCMEWVSGDPGVIVRSGKSVGYLPVATAEGMVCVTVAHETGSDGAVCSISTESIGSSAGCRRRHTIKAFGLRRAVHRALETKQPLQPLDPMQGVSEVADVHAVVDLACKRVYALRLASKPSATTAGALISIAPLTLYGATGATAKPRPVKEVAAAPAGFAPFDFDWADLPPAEPWPPCVQAAVSKDTSGRARGAAAGAAGDAGAGDLAELEARLIAHFNARFDQLEQHLSGRQDDSGACCTVS